MRPLRVVMTGCLTTTRIHVRAMLARYQYDRKPTFSLNPLQTALRDQIQRKVDQGIYPLETKPCLVCDGTRFQPIAEKDRYGLSYSVVLCLTCGLVQTNPRMTQDAYNAFYAHEYRRLYGGVEGPTEDFFGAQLQAGRMHYRYLRGRGVLPAALDGYRVLEVGCGAGGILQAFRDKGATVLGLDLDDEFLAFGRRKGLDLRNGTLATAIDWHPDFIIYSHVLEHILEPRSELQLVREVLPPDGRIYIEVPGIKHLWQHYHFDVLRYFQNAHITHFSLTTLTRLVESCGFRRVAGDERVHGVFTPSAASADAPDGAAEVEAVRRYLRRAERLRPLGLRHPSEFRDVPRRLVMNTARVLGVRALVRALRGRT